MKYPYDIMETLSPAQKLTAEVEVVNKVKSNWWEKMVTDSIGCDDKEHYFRYREEIDNLLGQALVESGNPKEHHFTKSGRIKVGSLFSTKEGYNSYRSAKSIIGNAIDLGVRLLEDGTPRPKTQVQEDIKAHTSAPKKTAFEIANKHADNILNLKDSLTDSEKERIYNKLSVFEPVPF